jgi:hypothetical protein
VRNFRIAAAAVLGVALVTTTAAMASAAPAQRYDPSASCADGIYAGYDGTQVNSDGQSVAVQDGQLQAVRDTRQADTCFYWFAYDGGQNKIAEYAPDGIASNEVMAAVWTWRGYQVELQRGNGSAYQQWNYNTADNGTWTNAGTGTVLAADSHGHLYLAPAPAVVPDSEYWTFQSS